MIYDKIGKMTVSKKIIDNFLGWDLLDVMNTVNTNFDKFVLNYIHGYSGK